MAPISVVSKKQTEITLQWSALTGIATGNSAILSYNLYWDNATGTTNEQVIDSLVTTHKVTGLIGGKNYKFKIRAKNVYGPGTFSAEVTVLSSDIPDQIGIATVTILGTNVVVDWNAPAANDSPISKYKILFKKSDGTFVEDTVNCNGTNGTIKSETKCSVVMSQVMSLTGL
jgi:hypothetical protein